MSIEEEEDASLKELVTRTLQSNGVLGKIQAQLRASVFLALEEEFREKNQPLVSQATRKLLATPEGATAAALVHDFLHTLGLDFSLAVFAPESGHPSAWSLPSVDALASRLHVGHVKKGSGIPLLVELVKARQTVGVEQRNGETSNSVSICSNSEKDPHSVGISSSAGGSSNLADINSNSPENSISQSSASSQTLSQDASKGSRSSRVDVSLQEERKIISSLSSHKQDVENGKVESRNGSYLQVSENRGRETARSEGMRRNDCSPPELAEEATKQDAESLMNGDDKHYEDDFSSMSERDGRDGNVEEEEEEEVTEDIEEDLSLDDLINSSASAASDQTKDQPLSKASNPPDYQESL